MDIRVLNYFVTIIQTRSITNAAKTLHVTQPTLSRQIKELEEELGTILFHRGSREIQLTDDGQYLYNRALEILTLVEQTENNIKKADTINGNIFIGAAETQSLDLIARVIEYLTSQCPKVKVHLRSGDANDILEKLNKGIFDLGIIIGKCDTKNYDFISLPSKDNLGIIVSKDHPLTKQKKIDLKTLKNYRLILSEQMMKNNELMKMIGNDIDIVATYNLLYNATLLVKKRVGIALALDGIVETNFIDSELKFIPVNYSEPIQLQLIWKKQSSQSELTKYFLECVYKELKIQNYL